MEMAKRRGSERASEQASERGEEIMSLFLGSSTFPPSLKSEKSDGTCV